MPDQQVTPEQIELMRAYGTALLPGQEVRHPLGGIANILSALVGHANIGRAETLRANQRDERARSLLASTLQTSSIDNPSLMPSPVVPPRGNPALPRASDRIQSSPNVFGETNVPMRPRPTTSSVRRGDLPASVVNNRTLAASVRPDTPSVDLPPREGNFIPNDRTSAYERTEQRLPREITSSNLTEEDLAIPRTPGPAGTINSDADIPFPPSTRPNAQRRSNLGLGDVAAEQAATERPRQTQVAQAGDNRRSLGAPPTTPPRIEPDPNIARLERLLSNGRILSEDELKRYTEQYMAAIGPQAREVPGGTAYYNGQTGELMYFTPKLLTTPVQTPGVSTQQHSTITPEGEQRIPPAPAVGGGNRRGSAVTNPNISTQASRPFPQGGNIEDLTEWGQEMQAQGGISEQMARGQAARVNQAIDASIAAPTALNTLNTLRTSTEAAGRSSWRGPGLGDWVQRVSQYLSNLGEGSIEQLRNLPHTELITKLNAQLASQAVQQISNRGSNFELLTFMNSIPGLSQSHNGAVMLLDFLQQEQRRNIAIGRLADDLRPNQFGQWNRMVQDYYNRHPTYLNVPPMGTPGTRSYRPAMRITTQTIPSGPEGEEIVRNLPEGVHWIDPNGNIRRGGIRTQQNAQ